jgi:O-antigen/teichoic acid export membrane protein
MVILSSLITSIVLFFIFVNDFSVSLYVIGYVIFTLITSDLLGKKLYRNYSKFIIMQKILMIILAIGFFYVLGIQGIILGIAISFFPFGFLMYKEFKNVKMDFSLVRSRAGFMFNNYLLNLANAFNGSLDKLIIAPLLGFGLLGNYQLGIQFMIILHLVPGIIFQYTLSHDATGNQNKLLKKSVILFSILLTFLSIILAPIVLPALFPKFIEAIEIIQIMSLSVIPATVITTYISKFLGMDKSKIVIIGSGLYLGIQIPTILTLGTIWGVNGAAISIVIATTIHAIYFILIDRFTK